MSAAADAVDVGFDKQRGMRISQGFEHSGTRAQTPKVPSHRRGHRFNPCTAHLFKKTRT